MLIATPPLRMRLQCLSLSLALLAGGGMGATAAAAAPTQAAVAPAAGSSSSAPQASTSFQRGLAEHLKRQGAVLYGAWWCPHCTHQRELFGLEAIELLPYVECDKDDAGRQTCQKAQVKAYPTWDFKGERRVGVLSLDELTIWSGYSPR